MSNLRSRPVALAGAYAAAAMALAAVQPISNGDTFGHLAQGRFIVANGGPPALDPFSFFRPEPQPWPNYEWLSDVVTWGIYALGGWNGLIAAAMVLAAAAALAVVLLGARLGGDKGAWLTALFLVSALPAVRFRLSARPHLVTAPLAGLYLHLLLRPGAFADPRRTRATVAMLVALQVLWANLHGSHLLGMAIVGVAAAASLPDWRRAGRFGALALLLGAVSCITPFGASLTVDAIRHVFDGELRGVISEWHDLSTGTAWTQGTMMVIAGAMVLAGLRVWSRGYERRVVFGVGLVLVVGSLRSLRFVLDGATFAAPALGLAVGDLLESPGLVRVRETVSKTPVFAAIAMVLAGLVGQRAVVVDSPIPPGWGIDTRFVPAEAVEHLVSVHPEARLFGSMPTTWYALFGAPEVRVLIDGRAPFYGPEHVLEMSRALNEEGRAARVVRRFDVDAVILQHTAPDEHAALVSMREDPAFVRTWMDGAYAVFVRRDRVRAEDYAVLSVLPTSYDGGEILGADAEAVPRLRAAVAALGPGPEASALRFFVQAMLRMRPLAREGGWAGFRAPETSAEEAAVALAYREIRATHARVGAVPSVTVQAMLMAAVSCELEEASVLLDEARAEGDTRETLFGAAEIDLRSGQVEATRAFLEAARAFPGATEDEWVRALEAELSSPPRCP